MSLTEDYVLAVLRRTDGLPPARPGHSYRTIYEAGRGPNLRPSGHFYIDYASFPGGTVEEVPRSVIDSLLAKGEITQAYPGCNAWRLKKKTGGMR